MAELPLKVWQDFIWKLRQVNDQAEARIRAYIAKYRIPQTYEEYQQFLDYAYAVSTKFGEAAGEIAAEMYEAEARAAKVVVKAAVPAEPPSIAEVAKTVFGTVKTGNEEIISSAVGRLVKKTGANTTLKNAIRDGAQYAWIPHGDTCSFCIMLASNGWMSGGEGLKNGQAAHIHANCDCTYGVRFDGKSGVAGYDPDKYKEMYDNAEGDTWQEKLNSMRRDEYEKNKDEINAKKREAYTRKNEFISVYDNYKKTATPGIGEIDIPKGRKIKNNEERNLRLIHAQFGGDISMPIEDYTSGKKNPDYYWRKKFWEEQEPVSFSKNAVDKNIREALHQIYDNPGGIILDIGTSKMSTNEVGEIALKRMRRSSPFDCDLILIRDGVIEEVWRYRKIKR